MENREMPAEFTPITRNGKPWLRHLSGREIPVVSGAQDDPPPPAPPAPPAPPEPPAPRTFEQDEVTRLMAREKHQGSEAGRNALLAELGLDPAVAKPEDIKALIEKAAQADDAAKTEAQRDREAAAAEKAKADALTATATDMVRDAAVTLGLTRALVLEPEAQTFLAPTIASRLPADLDMTDRVKVAEAVDAAIDLARKALPTAFPPAPGTPPPPAPGAGGTPPPPAPPKPGQETAEERGRARAEAINRSAIQTPADLFAPSN